MTVHYTAVVEITKTSHVEPPRPTYNDRRHDAPKIAEGPRRDVDELARIIVRAASVEQLREKVAAHVQLVEEVGA